MELLLQTGAFCSSKCKHIICCTNWLPLFSFFLFLQRDLGLNKDTKWVSRLFHWQGISMVWAQILNHKMCHWCVSIYIESTVLYVCHSLLICLEQVLFEHLAPFSGTPFWVQNPLKSCVWSFYIYWKLVRYKSQALAQNQLDDVPSWAQVHIMRLHPAQTFKKIYKNLIPLCPTGGAYSASFRFTC